MILYLDFAVRITSNIQTLILDFVSPPTGLLLEITSDPPIPMTPFLRNLRVNQGEIDSDSSKLKKPSSLI